jgi:hypothetical protein
MLSRRADPLNALIDLPAAGARKSGALGKAVGFSLQLPVARYGSPFLPPEYFSGRVEAAAFR